MKGELVSIRLEDSEGTQKTLGDCFNQAAFTVLVFYRGDW
jgi:hypothetical protein